MTTNVGLPADAAKRFREKARETILDLLPEEQLDQYYEQEVKAFFEQNTETVTIISGAGYGSNTSKAVINVTPFRALVWTELMALKMNAVQEHMRSKEFIAKFIDPDATAKSAEEAYANFATQMVENMAPIMAQHLFKGSIVSMLNASQDQMVAGLQQAFYDKGMPEMNFNNAVFPFSTDPAATKL